MKNLLFLACLILFVACAEQKQESTLKQVSDFYPKEKTQVLVVGTFHFNYPGADYYKSSEENKVDVLKEPKKTEVAELVEYIKKFKPNKIAIEAFPKFQATTKLGKYKKGEFRDKRGEEYQLAMRIASDLQLDTLYAIDSWALSEYRAQIDSTYFANLFKDYDFQSDDPYNQYVFDSYKEEEKLRVNTNLLDYFKFTNSKEYHDHMYGAYLVGDFKLEDYRGADILSMWWYNRNLRIFRNLQKITESENDRILVIFGNGHASVFRQLLEASPEYEFVEFDSL
jgi:hypothetical protein